MFTGKLSPFWSDWQRNHLSTTLTTSPLKVATTVMKTLGAFYHACWAHCRKHLPDKGALAECRGQTEVNRMVCKQHAEGSAGVACLVKWPATSGCLGGSYSRATSPGRGPGSTVSWRHGLERYTAVGLMTPPSASNAHYFTIGCRDPEKTAVPPLGSTINPRSIQPPTHKINQLYLTSQIIHMPPRPDVERTAGGGHRSGKADHDECDIVPTLSMPISFEPKRRDLHCFFVPCGGL